MRLLLTCVALLWTSSFAAADNRLKLPEGVSPRSLHMRAAAWRVAASETVPKESKPGSESIFNLPSGDSLSVGDGDLDRLIRHGLEHDVAAPPKPLSERLTLRFNLGMGLDGGQPSGKNRLTDSDPEGPALNERQDYERLRIYSFGDAVVGSRGLGMEGLNSYLAAHFRYNQPYSQHSSAIPSLYDRNFSQPVVRSGYVEVDEVFQHRLLKPVHVRAGRSFQYGISAFQFDGLTVGYHTPALRLSVFGGQRSSLVGLDNSHYRGGGEVIGSRVRADLFEWKRWPLVISAAALRFDAHSHFRTGLALRWNRDVLVGAQLRALDGEVARASFSVAARLSQVTTVNLQVHRRTSSDWSYGLSQVSPGSDDDTRSDPRRYLDLGPVLPRTHLRLRYGTVLLRNIDLLIRGGGAIDGHDEETSGASSSSSSYAEGGAAVEVHMRRAIRLGAAMTTRRYFLDGEKHETPVPGTADPLPKSMAATGVASFWEGGLSLVYSPGARLFRGSAEFYGRRYGYLSEYLTQNITAFRSGGRFSIEGWVGKRIRMKAEYDVTLGPLLMAPELRGLKTLRVLLEGTF
ncbi:MAG: hypothetical protein GY811_18440 [Myxococcales bacterium]|nr:hypothetical protein [Myxococcales bacterium]